MSGREVGSLVAQDLVGRGVRAERPAHCDDCMLRCSHPMRAAAENFIRVFFLGHPVECKCLYNLLFVSRSVYSM